jgi:antirestriction protein
VASLTDYNAGVLHGAWVYATVGVEVVQTSIDQMLAESPTAAGSGEVAEEFAIHDFDGFGRHLHLGEYEPLHRVCLLAEGIVEHGDAFGAWMAQRGDDELPSPETFEDHFLGEYGSLAQWGEQLLDELGVSRALDELPDVPESLRPYVRLDVEGWVRDMYLNGEIYAVESTAGVYVYWSET